MKKILIMMLLFSVDLFSVKIGECKLNREQKKAINTLFEKINNGDIKIINNIGEDDLRHGFVGKTTPYFTYKNIYTDCTFRWNQSKRDTLKLVIDYLGEPVHFIIELSKLNIRKKIGYQNVETHSVKIWLYDICNYKTKENNHYVLVEKRKTRTISPTLKDFSWLKEFTDPNTSKELDWE